MVVPKEIEKRNSKATSSPIDPNHRIGLKDGGNTVKRQLPKVSCQINISHTKLDIVYSMGIASQFMHDPREEYVHVSVSALMLDLDDI